MKLWLDIGNTRLKWATGNVPALVTALAHHGEPAAALTQLLASLPDITEVWISQVTAAEQALRLACQQQQLPVQFAHSCVQLGPWRSGYLQPERLGVDRMLAMLQAPELGRAAYCIASSGTALTFDAVDASGQHLGGIIAPGLAATVTATLANTRFEAQIKAQHYSQHLGQTTEQAVLQGALHANAGLLQRLARRYPHAPLYLCGGDAPQLLLALPEEGWQLAPDAVLQGLVQYARWH